MPRKPKFYRPRITNIIMQEARDAYFRGLHEFMNGRNQLFLDRMAGELELMESFVKENS